MREFIETYKEHQEEIEFFIQESIKNLGNLFIHKNDNFAKVFSVFPSLELIYFTNKDTKIQSASNYYRNRLDPEAQGKNRSHLISKLEFKEEDIAFSKPYISSATRNTCITVTIKENDQIIFLDFILDILLEKLNLIELNQTFHKVTKAFYITAGFSMVLLSIMTIGYSLYEFVYYIFMGNDF